MMDHFRLGQARSSQNRSSTDISYKDRSSYDGPFQDRSSQERSSQDSGQVMSSQDRSTLDRLGLVRSTQDRDQFFLKSCFRDQVDHWTVASVYLDFNRTKRKTLTWDSSVALLSSTCFILFLARATSLYNLAGYLITVKLVYSIQYMSKLSSRQAAPDLPPDL